MIKSITIVSVLAIIALSSAGCSLKPQYPEYQHEIKLEVGGSGYEVGDIVLIDTRKELALGDIVQYDSGLNKSNCMAMGPGTYLAKIIGLPGDNVSFDLYFFSANGYTGSFKYGPGIWPRTKPTMWGTTRYEDAANMELLVPEGEFLADNWTGLECTGEIDETHSSKTYNRFTVKKEAILGVILKNLGHDTEFEKRVKGRVY